MQWKPLLAQSFEPVTFWPNFFNAAVPSSQNLAVFMVKPIQVANESLSPVPLN